MEINIVLQNGYRIAVVQSDELLITDTQSALDFMAAIRYQAETEIIAVNKEAITEDFFVLSTCIAGEILQKFVTYNVKLAIVGDFSGYTSKPLKDFIYESNHGSHIFFVASIDEAIKKLTSDYRVCT